MIDAIYPSVEGIINKVIERAPNEISNETIKKQLKSGLMFMVAICDDSEIVAVNILEVKQFETGHKVLYIPITAGTRMDEWLGDFLETANKYAKENGCHEMRGLACRKGWTRALKQYEWYDIHTVIGCKVK